MLERYPGAFRRALRGSPRAGATNDSSSEPRSRDRASAVYSVLVKENACLAELFGQLKTAGMVFTKTQAPCSGMAMVVPKGSGFRMVGYCPAVNQLVKQAPMPIPLLEVLAMLLGGAAAFCALDMIQGY